MWDELRIGDLVAWRRGPADASTAIIVLHGGPGLSDYTEPLADLVSAQLPDAQVARYQQRGVVPPSLDGPVTVEQHIEDLTVVASACAAERVVLLGHSWGGHLALHAIAASPGSYVAAIAVDPLGGVGDGGLSKMRTALRARCTDEAQTKLADIAARRERESANDVLALEELEILWPSYFADPNAAPAMPQLAFGAARAAETWASISENMRDKTLEHRLVDVATPTLFLVGGRSPIPNDASTRTADLMSHSVVRCHPDAGHFPWIEDPAWTVDEIAGFLHATSTDASNIAS